MIPRTLQTNSKRLILFATTVILVIAGSAIDTYSRPYSDPADIFLTSLAALTIAIPLLFKPNLANLVIWEVIIIVAAFLGCWAICVDAGALVVLVGTGIVVILAPVIHAIRYFSALEEKWGGKGALALGTGIAVAILSIAFFGFKLFLPFLILICIVAYMASRQRRKDNNQLAR